MAAKNINNNKRKKNDNKNEKPALIHGRYEIDELLGQGSFAKVYHACNIISNESVAIKVMDKEKIFKYGIARQIKRDIHSLRRVRPPNIVQIFEVMATKAKIYIVKEYVRGGELLKKVTKGRLKEQVARKYFQQLISAVRFCHSRGLFHRDLKPENLLLDENGNLKVTDFGLSTLSDQVSHTFCGTPAYLAPEVLLLTMKGYQAAKVEARFVSHAPVPKIIMKLEEIAKIVNFVVRKKGCRVSLQGSRESVKGPLVITAEIFELTSSVVVVKLKRRGGESGEYEEFCYNRLIPGLQNLVQEESASASHLSSYPE